MKSDKRKITKINSQIDKIATKGKDNFLEYCQYVDDCIFRSDYDNLLQCLYHYYNIDIDKLNTIEDIKRKKVWDLIRLNTNTSLSKKIKKLYDSKNVYQTSFDIWSQDPKYVIIGLSKPLSVTYSSASASAGIDVTRSNSTLNIDILNPKIYEIVISKTTWTGTPSIPSNIEKYQEIRGITQSSYELEIPTTFDTQWLINTKERSPFRELNYKFNLSANKYLGKIVEIDDYNDETKYLIKNRQFSRITKTRRNHLEVNKVISYQPLIFDEPLILEDYDYSISDDENIYNKYVRAINLLIS